MQKTATLNIRLNPDLKLRAEKLYGLFGITLSDAVAMFFSQSLLVGGLPFDLRLPERTESEYIAESLGILKGTIPAKTYNTVEEMFADINGE